MARSAAEKASEAADRLLDWMQGQRAVQSTSASGGDAGAGRPEETGNAITVLPEVPTGLGQAPASGSPALGNNPTNPSVPLRLPHTDWLYHRLVLTGPSDEVAAFRTAAAGAGTIPWQLDLYPMEEDLFHLLLAPPPPQRRVLSAAGARVLAGQLREAATVRHAAAVARVGRSRACPFDLHALVPVPDEVLRLGPDHPDALFWLWEHWGTTEALRHVQEDRYAILGRHPVPRTDPGSLHLSFWSADWTPWRALAQVAAVWTALRFDLTPVYDGR